MNDVRRPEIEPSSSEALPTGPHDPLTALKARVSKLEQKLRRRYSARGYFRLLRCKLRSPRRTHPALTTSLAAYNQLRENMSEAAKHARNQLLAHVFVTTYGLMTLATLKDADFFERSKGVIKLPVIGMDVPLAHYLPGIAAASAVVFFYFHFYLQRAWEIARRAKAVASQHSSDPAFVPLDGLYRYPWIAFAVDEPGWWNRLTAVAFGFVQWGLTPALLVACSMRTIRLGGGLVQWITLELPWHWPFTLAAVLSPVLAVGARLQYHRRVGIVRAYPKTLAAVLTLVGLAAVVAAIAASRLHPLSLPRANLHARLLRGVALRGADLRGAKLDRADLQGANLRRADLARASLRGAVLRGCQLGWADLDRADLSHADLRGADLSEAQLGWADVFWVDLRGPSAIVGEPGTSQRWINLVQTNLNGADLRGANLAGANLGQARLHGANLHHADLSGADLRHTRQLQQSQLTHACGDDRTRLPAHLTIDRCRH